MTSDGIEPIPVVMKVETAARICECEPTTIERYIHNGELDAVHVGKQRRIRGTDLLEFIARRPPTRGSRSGAKRVVKK